MSFVLLVGAAGAQDAAPAKWSLGVGVGPNLSELDAVGDELKSSIGGAVWLSREWGARSRLDLSFDYFDFDSPGTGYPALSLAYGLRFFTDSKLKPFVMAGAGAGQAKFFPRAVDTNQTAPHFFARAGVKELFGNETWAVGLLYDFLFVKLDDNQATSALLGLPMLTLTWNFDSEKKREEPPKVAVVSPPKIDTDGDGVYDHKDECPDTPRGSKVNSIGCLLKQSVTKRLEIEFDTGKSVVKEDYFAVIDSFGQFMTENVDLTVTIEGHTDSTGSRKLNLKLSSDRAAAVRTIILSRHSEIDPKRLRFKGYGPDQPVGSNDSDEGRQKNRRVVAVVMSN